MSLRLPSVAILGLLVVWMVLSLSCHGPAAPGSRSVALATIVSSGRSGSSLVGAIFRSNPEVFYLYEPCRMGRLQDEGCWALIASIFDCSVTEREWDFLRSDEPAVRLQNSGFAFNGSYTHFLAECKKRHRIVKEIRLDGGYRQRPRAPIIYLIRHPLAVASSYFELKMHSCRGNWTACAAYVCDKIARIHRSMAATPRLTLHFEDLARDPVPIVTDMFDTLGIPMHVSTYQWIYDNMKSLTNNGRFQTKRLAVAEIDEWRKVVTPTMLRAARPVCELITSLQGYDYP